MDRTELLSKMHGGRKKLEEALARVDEQGMGEIVLHGDWSVKDLLAHLAFWERRAVSLYQALAGNKPWEGVTGESGVDLLNAQAMQEGRRYSLDEVRREEEDAWQAILALAYTAPDEDLFGLRRFPWTDGHPFYEWVEGNAYGHYEEHLPELYAWLDRKEASR
jgi:hypothetical protein